MMENEKPVTAKQFFSDPENQKRLHDAAMRLCEWLHKNEIRIIVNDGDHSKEITRQIMKMWHQKFPHANFPRQITIPEAVNRNGDTWRHLESRHQNAVNDMARGEKVFVFTESYVSHYSHETIVAQLKVIGATHVIGGVLAISPGYDTAHRKLEFHGLRVPLDFEHFPSLVPDIHRRARTHFFDYISHPAPPKEELQVKKGFRPRPKKRVLDYLRARLKESRESMIHAPHKAHGHRTRVARHL